MRKTKLHYTTKKCTLRTLPIGHGVTSFPPAGDRWKMGTVCGKTRSQKSTVASETRSNAPWGSDLYGTFQRVCNRTNTRLVQKYFFPLDLIAVGVRSTSEFWFQGDFKHSFVNARHFNDWTMQNDRTRHSLCWGVRSYLDISKLNKHS